MARGASSSTASARSTAGRRTPRSRWCSTRSGGSNVAPASPPAVEAASRRRSRRRRASPLLGQRRFPPRVAEELLETWILVQQDVRRGLETLELLVRERVEVGADVVDDRAERFVAEQREADQHRVVVDARSDAAGGEIDERLDAVERVVLHRRPGDPADESGHLRLVSALVELH